MRVLLVGSGGREHALAWKISQSPLLEKLYCLPGNAGTSGVAENVFLPQNNESIVKFSLENKIDLVVVGSEQPLVNGLVDELERNGIKAFGPYSDATQLEGSKEFTRNIAKKSGVLQPEFHVFTDSKKAIKFIEKENKAFVVKADGLAAGKGVIVAKDKQETISAVKSMLEEKAFGSSGEKILLEEKLVGIEVSFLALVDSLNILPLETAQDFKRAFDDDKGPNTGGMGSFSPNNYIDKEMKTKILEKIMKPVVKTMAEMGCPFKGLLYAGLMISNNIPYLIEFNVRFGDPETQAILPRMESDLLPLLVASAQGNLAGKTISWSNKKSCSVVLASKGYPNAYEKGFPITGLENFKNSKKTIIFHAGTKIAGGRIVTDGGRVLNVTSLGNSLKDAREKAYSAIEKISFKNESFRKDIALKAAKGPD